MTTELSVDEESLSRRRIESMRLKVKQCLSCDTMHPTWVSTFDIVSCDLEHRDTTYDSSMSDIYIILVDSGFDLAVWSEYLWAPTDIQTRIVCRESEDLEVCIDMVSSDIGRSCICDLLPIDDSPSYKSNSLREDESSLIVPISLSEEHISKWHTRRYYYLNLFDLSAIEQDGIYCESEWRCDKWGDLHARKYREKGEIYNWIFSGKYIQ